MCYELKWLMVNILATFDLVLSNVWLIIADNWCRFPILLVESRRIVVISGTVHWFLLKTSFHPLLCTSSGLTGS